MKLEIYNCERKKVFLKLQRLFEGTVSVCVCDETDGSLLSGGTICTIRESGLYLPPNIKCEFGFALDKDGRIKIKEIQQCTGIF